MFFQLIGVGVPLLGCIALFKKEQTKATMSLLLTNIGCLFLNCIYMLMLGSDNEGAALMANKILYLATTLFYFSFMLFIATYLDLGTQRLRTSILSVWAGIEILFLFMLFIGDPFHVVFLDVQVQHLNMVDITLVRTIPSVLYMVRNCLLCIMLVIGMIVTMIRMCKVRAKEEKYNLARLVGAQFIVVGALHIRLLFMFPYDIVPLSASLSILSIIVGVIHGEFFYVTDQGRNWVVEHMENVLIITDNQYGYLDANPAAKMLFPELNKLEKNEIIPGRVISLFYDYNYCVDLDDRHYVKEVERVVHKNRTIGYSMLLIDNTQHHNLMEKIEEEKIRAEEANKAKSDFMSNMSHEIRTPMNAIVGMTEILLREDLPASAKEYLNNIRSSGDALLTIINDILDFSKIEAGQMDIIEDEYEPMSMFQDLSMIFLNRIGEKDVELLYDIDVDLPAKLYGDRQRIRQVIINLMNNAIKFTDSGFVKLIVTIEPIDEENVNVIYRVQDTGQGIKEQDIGKLFGTYSQVDKEKNHYKEGTGLGLSISKHMVELMGGTIGVTSEYGKGSTFFFQIPQHVCSIERAAEVKSERIKHIVVTGHFVNPLINEQYKKLLSMYNVRSVEFHEVCCGEAKADIIFTDDAELFTIDMCEKIQDCITRLCVLQNPMQQNLSEKKVTLVNKPFYSLNFCQIVNGEVIVREKEEEVLNFTAPDAKFLIVDDNEMNIKVARGLLEPLRVQIDIAENGKEAVDRVCKKDYDIIFMDHMMPVMDGVEATRAIRGLEGEQFHTMPIVALSANATKDAREFFAVNGFTDFVAKPIKLKELCACIRKWLPEELIVIDNFGRMKESEQTDADSEFEVVELVIEGLDVKEGISNSGNKKLFLNLLGDFYKLIDPKSAKIEEYLSEGRIREYTIEVHALKSTARMIGALELSEKFYQLEMLGNAENEAALRLETPGVLALYRSYKQILEPFANVDEQKKEVVSKEEMIETLEDLRNAIDCFDLDGADYAMHKLEGIVFPQEYQHKVVTLSALVADVAMEDVMNLTDELIEDLKK